MSMTNTKILLTSQKGLFVVGEDTNLLITSHAVERYNERFAPGLEFEAARRHLRHLLSFAEITDIPPKWLAARKEYAKQQGFTPHDNQQYLVISDDIVFPLIVDFYRENTLSATTCLSRGGISDAARATRNAKRNRKPRKSRNPIKRQLRRQQDKYAYTDE